MFPLTASALDQAWRRVLSDAYEDEIPDILRWEDHKLAWPGWRAELEQGLADDSYSPSTPQVVEVPKDSFATRPIALLRPQDRVVYEALIDLIAPHVDPLLPDAVYSARLRKRKAAGIRIRPQVKQWLRFQEAGKKLYDEFEYAYLLTTDVTSYFEYVDIRTLLEDLRALDGIESGVIDLLSMMLNKFEGSSNVWGIPQGPEGSSVLGNFYLLPVDRVLELHDAQYIRFQDDIKVFSDNPSTLRLLYTEMVHVLRSRRLNFSVHKTKLLEGLEILAEFEDDRKTAIQYGLKVGADGTSELLHQLFDAAVSENPPPARDVRFAVYRLANLEDPYAISWILEHLHEVPYLAGLLVNYLSVHYEGFPEIEERVVDFLHDTSRNIYPFVEMHLIRMLSRAPQLGERARSLVWRVLRDQNKRRYVREHAIRCAGRHARQGEAQVLRSMMFDSSDVALKRACLVGMREAGVDRAFFAQVAGREPLLAHTCDYLRAASNLPDP